MAWSRHRCSVPGAASAGATLLMWVSVVMFALSVCVALSAETWRVSELFTWFVVVVYSWAGRRVIASVTQEAEAVDPSSSPEVSCFLCCRTIATTEAVANGWRFVRRFSCHWPVCPSHFPLPGARPEDVLHAWTVIHHLIDQELPWSWDDAENN